MRRPVSLTLIAALSPDGAPVGMSHATRRTFSCGASGARAEGTPGGRLGVEPVGADALRS